MRENNNGLSFFDIYEREISSKIKEMDILLKSGGFPVELYKAAKILNISDEEAENIIKKAGISRKKGLLIDKNIFFALINKGSSEICRLYQRELSCGSPYLYTRENIAYIYNLDISLVQKACRVLNLTVATETMLPYIFKKIPAAANDLK